MTTDRSEATLQGHNQIIGLIIERVSRAQADGHITDATNAEMLGRQLGLQLLALLGIWAAGHMTIDETIDQTKAAWAAILLGSATATSSEIVSAMLSSAQKSIGVAIGGVHRSN